MYAGCSSARDKALLFKMMFGVNFTAFGVFVDCCSHLSQSASLVFVFYFRSIILFCSRNFCIFVFGVSYFALGCLILLDWK